MIRIYDLLIWGLTSQWMSHTKSKTSSLFNFSIVPFQIVILLINCKHMDIFPFKFDQKCTRNDESYFSNVRGRGNGPHFQIAISIIIGKYMKMLCLKFQQDHNIMKNFTFLRGWGGDPQF